jgi:hypothetical protein
MPGTPPSLLAVVGVGRRPDPNLGRDTAWRHPETIFVSLRHFSRPPHDAAIGRGVKQGEKSPQFWIMILRMFNNLSLCPKLLP